MYILGISCYYHDSAAALIKDGFLVAAAEEERFTRIKHDFSFPQNAIRFCLESEGISPAELDYVVFHEKPFLKFERIIKSILATCPRSAGLYKEVAINWLKDKLWIKTTIAGFLNIPESKILFSEHHLSHASSAFFCSPYQEAAILTVDGVGEWATLTLGKGKADWKGGGKNQIVLFEEIRFPHSLGLLYSVFTAFLGFKVNNGEYKVMGMSAFGKPRYIDRVYQLIKVNSDGSFKLNMKYFSYHYSTKKSFNENFVKLFGQPRKPGSRFILEKHTTPSQKSEVPDEEIRENQRFADIAASIQKVTEEILLKIANHLYQKTGSRNLCLAGGVALNCVANYKLLTQTPFENIFIQPAAGDSGAALGAALYVWHCLLNKKREFVLPHAYWGKQYSTEEIREFLEKNQINFRWFSEERKLIQYATTRLLEQKVVGWFQNRFEWGPRALGNRSILADPRNPRMKDILNLKIKFREPFRPFAPSVLRERAQDFFQVEEPDNHLPLRYMLYTVAVKKKELIPAVTHVDSSSRIQILSREDNPLYYSLIENFYSQTGIPLLLNTSFNLKGEPIVTSPEDAYSTFSRSGIDLLILGNFAIEKG